MVVYFSSLALYIITGVLIWTFHNSVTEYYYLYVFGAAVGFGVVYSIIKITLASITARQTKDGCCYDLMVDVLTDQVALELADNDITSRYSLPQ